ncbi:MAG: methyltransferase domain-containing protein [Gemmatimonadetes bacterium]|nr:methyltransferase domain-containing protein [Gemmatimonadota bacterium]
MDGRVEPAVGAVPRLPGAHRGHPVRLSPARRGGPLRGGAGRPRRAPTPAGREAPGGPPPHRPPGPDPLVTAFAGFSEGAGAYARHRPAYPAALADALAELAPARRLAWDAGCGSGQLSTLLGERFDRVVASDASAEQVAHARPHPRVEYRIAPAGESGLPADSVDLAAAAQAAHWFDLDAWFAEVARVARRGAAVAMVTYGDVEVEGAPGRVVDRFNRETLAPWWAPERRHVVDGYASLDLPFARVAVRVPDMTAEWDADALLGYVGTWSAVRALEGAGGRETIDAFAEEVRRAWGPGRRGVRWPLTVRAGRVRAERPG